MRVAFVALALLCACGPAPTPPVDGGTITDGGDQSLPFTELPPERLAFTCREIVGGSFVSLDPLAPSQWRAHADGVILHSADEGRTWTRAPVQTSFAANNLFVGPVILAQANTDPQVADAGLRVSVDRGLTWNVPNFTVVDDPRLPPATAVATIGTTKVAWSPSGVIRVSSDDGQSWRSEPNAIPNRDPEDLRVALDEREWFLDAKEQQLFRSRDSGRTWQKLPFRRFRFLELLGKTGVVAADQPRTGLWISQDDGDTWVNRTGLTSVLAVGPADGELWGVTAVVGAEKARLMHSMDWGASFAPVEISYGASGTGLGIEPGVARVFATADGRRVMVPRTETVPLNPFSRMACVETTGEGAIEQAAPAKSDAPGTSTMWALGNFGFALGTLQQAVPLREPGRAFGITKRTFPDTVAITGGTRLPNGDVAILLKPAAVIDPNAGPPMRVQVLDGTSLQNVRELRFTNLLRTTTGRETKYLESRWLQGLPDGGLRTDTSEGDYPIGVDPAVHAEWPSNARWGRGGNGAQLVTSELIGATRFLRLSNELIETRTFCVEAAGPTDRCISYAGQIQDWGVRHGRLYVLDAWKGEVLEANYASRDNVFRTVLTGLALPTSLYVPTDDDPGVYVVDTHLYRVVPGATAARRP
ncbi:MAG: hypothetical protein Q8N26_02285 [Myxococcales bacterium]|nr:hypothetical protein [Myxococcales bacterium]